MVPRDSDASTRIPPFAEKPPPGGASIPYPPMTEDELLTGVTDTLTLGGWRWQHIRRSDRALVQGHPGFPDVVAAHPDKPLKCGECGAGVDRMTGGVIAIECKSATGRATPDQIDWLALLEAGGWVGTILRPQHFDQAVAWLLGDRLMAARKGAR